MTEIQLNGRTEFEFVIPTLSKDKQPIPSDRVEAYIRAIESRSITLNDGFKRFSNCQGGYQLKSGEIQYEDILVIQTHGHRPLTTPELELFADYLDQECLFVKEAGECKAYLHEGAKFETNYTYFNGDGSFTEFSLAIGEGGRQYVYQFDYDEDGMPSGGGELLECEICQMISEGDAALAGILQNLINP